MKIPSVTFSLITFEQNMDLIAMFLEFELMSEKKSNTNFFLEKFPAIKSIDYRNMKQQQLSGIFKLMLYEDWKKLMIPYLDKVSFYQEDWKVINDRVMTDLSLRLNVEWPEDALDIEAFIGIFYSCPRNIGNRTFFISGDFNLNRMREVSIHEICHFIYFEKWKELFNDYDEVHYNSPHIIWHLSEAIIDPLLNNEVFIKHTQKEILSYKVFYETMIDDKSVIDNLRHILTNYPIEEAIKRSYNMFLDNEDIIKPKESRNKNR